MGLQNQTNQSIPVSRTRLTEAGGNFVEAINSRRDVRFRWWRLIASSDFEASNDPNQSWIPIMKPTKVWTGEVGAVVIRNPRPKLIQKPPMLSNKYSHLNNIWRRYNYPCSREDCPLCRPKRKADNDNLDESRPT